MASSFTIKFHNIHYAKYMDQTIADKCASYLAVTVVLLPPSLLSLGALMARPCCTVSAGLCRSLTARLQLSRPPSGFCSERPNRPCARSVGELVTPPASSSGQAARCLSAGGFQLVTWRARRIKLWLFVAVSIRFRSPLPRLHHQSCLQNTKRTVNSVCKRPRRLRCCFVQRSQKKQ
jgi:hypothetical protein